MTPEVGICAIGAHVPAQRVDLRPSLEGFGVNEEFLRRKTGYLTLARKAESQETSELAELAVRGLLKTYPFQLNDVGVLVVVTQNPDGFGLPHTSAVLHGRLGLPTSVAAFDISLGCSGWVYGLSVVKSFMEANSIRWGLLVTADPYSKVIDAGDKNTALLFGDAATATLLGAERPCWRVGKFRFGTDGTRWLDLHVDEKRKLRMNGTGVFTFSATKIPDCIRETIVANELSMTDIDRILLHQGSRYIVDTIGVRLGVAEKTPFSDNGVGNTVSSTIPMMLADGRFDDDRRIIACGFGVGLSWAATMLANARMGVRKNAD
jgi:3-oxoacyl-[acyl-carrier-protein] synthase-3